MTHLLFVVVLIIEGIFAIPMMWYVWGLWPRGWWVLLAFTIIAGILVQIKQKLFGDMVSQMLTDVRAEQLDAQHDMSRVFRRLSTLEDQAQRR